MGIQFTDLAHLHVIVDDLDAASRFYREVFGFVEMQSHDRISNAGLAAYYGHEGDPEDLKVSLRFLFIPEFISLKLVRLETTTYSGARQLSAYSAESSAAHCVYGRRGPGPISVVVEDLQAAYDHILAHARDYSGPDRIQILSKPTFLSPLLPHQIGTTEASSIHGRNDILDTFAETWPFRAKFHVIDPFGVQWEFNNDVDGLPDTV